ncbi:MAG: hypothetical protein K1X90_03070 [Candidatus Kapabacteria bacterium]|nr:hypothetical protein [Candidatus Kapabacteria bacterium]
MDGVDAAAPLVAAFTDGGVLATGAFAVLAADSFGLAAAFFTAAPEGGVALLFAAAADGLAGCFAAGAPPLAAGFAADFAAGFAGCGFGLATAAEPPLVAAFAGGAFLVAVFTSVLVGLGAGCFPAAAPFLGAGVAAALAGLAVAFLVEAGLLAFVAGVAAAFGLLAAIACSRNENVM